MSEAQQLTMAALGGTHLGSRTVSYEERDAILYALAVGVSPDDLDHVYEKRLRVLPTYALPLGLWAVWACGALGAYDDRNTLHVGQQLEVLEELPRSASFETTAVVGSVWDKGSSALVDVDVASEYFRARYTIFVPGGGGFGGERGRRAGPREHSGSPVVTTVRTQPGQAALYRLTGDLHPLHIDPDLAVAAGFARPILHGLCTLGAVTHSLAAAAGRDVQQLSSLAASFSAPVLPGETIEVRAWREDDEYDYVADVGATGTVLSGTARFAAG